MARHIASRPGLQRALAAATRLARAEIIVALREPQRQLVTLLQQRSKDLEEIADLEVFVEEVGQEQWGTW